MKILLHPYRRAQQLKCPLLDSPNRARHLQMMKRASPDMDKPALRTTAPGRVMDLVNRYEATESEPESMSGRLLSLRIPFSFLTVSKAGARTP